MLLFALAAAPVRLTAQQPLTLDDALREARAANAQLPVAALDVGVARAEVAEARAARWPRISLEGQASGGAPLAYTTSQGLAQVVASDTLIDGGLRRATVAAGRYRVEAAGAGYRMAQKDLDLAVRLRFSEFVKADEEITFRREGIERLESYLSQIRARKAAGQPVGSDVLTTQVRLGTEQATLADAERAEDEARLQLNDLLGRMPDAPLALAPLPPPAAPAPPPDTAWLSAPEVRQAAASRAAAEAIIGATRAERRPQLSVAANVGALPVFSDSNPGTGINSGSGLGAAVVFSLSWPVWDGGVYRARLGRAQIAAEQARGAEIVARRQSRLAWQFAAAQRIRLYQQIEVWARNVPDARDAYLQTASMYNGGGATALEVLDAYAAWINASESYADAVLRYRQAEANSLRWGTP